MRRALAILGVPLVLPLAVLACSAPGAAFAAGGRGFLSARGTANYLEVAAQLAIYTRE